MFHHKHTEVPHHLGASPEVGYGDPDDGQDYIDRTKLTFDPVEGLLSGTAIPKDQHYHGHREQADPDTGPAV
jgi:hypothetical protein